jgi:CubicO group peptidase (beta-lactamase class C family)
LSHNGFIVLQRSFRHFIEPHARMRPPQLECRMIHSTHRFAFAVIFAAALLAAASPVAKSAPETKATLATTDASQIEWPTAAPAAVQLDGARLAELDQAITDGKYKGITSVLVVRDGKLAHESYFNGGARDTLNDMRSATKTITALLVGAAIDRQRIANADASVYGFFKDRTWQHADKRKAAFTLQDLLTMSSRWECNDENQFSTGNEERMYVTEDWTQFTLDLPIRGYAPWDTKPADAPYGRSFSYCTAGSYLLGVIVERATGVRLDRFAHDALEAPLGINTVKWNLSPEGSGVGAGGTRYRSRDIAKIGEMMRLQGQWHGKTVLSREWIAAMLTPRAVPRDATEYGYLMWRMSFVRDGKPEWAWAMGGNGGNYVLVMPERRLVAVITSSAYNQGYAHPQSQEIFRDYILRAAR